MYCVWKQPAVLWCGGQRLCQGIHWAVTICKLLPLQWVTVKKEFGQHPLQDFAAPQGIFWLNEGHLRVTLFHYFCSLGTLLPAALQGSQHAAWDFASQLTGVLRRSNEANAAKMLIVLQSGRNSFHIQLTAKPVTTSWILCSRERDKGEKPAVSAFPAQSVLSTVCHALLHHSPSLLHSSGRFWHLGLRCYEVAKAFSTTIQRSQKPESFLLSKPHVFALSKLDRINREVP